MNQHPDEDDVGYDVEEGDILFDDGSDAYEAYLDKLEAETDWLNRQDSRGYAPADFIYEPPSRKEFT